MEKVTAGLIFLRSKENDAHPDLVGIPTRLSQLLRRAQKLHGWECCGAAQKRGDAGWKLEAHQFHTVKKQKKTSSQCWTHARSLRTRAIDNS
jgi:hypothetical protein